MLRGEHEDYLLLLVDLIEKPPTADSIAPSWRVPVLQAFDVWPDVRFHSKLRVDEFQKLGFKRPLDPDSPAGEVAEELLGFENPIAWGRNGPFAFWHRQNQL